MRLLWGQVNPNRFPVVWYFYIVENVVHIALKTQPGATGGSRKTSTVKKEMIFFNIKNDSLDSPKQILKEYFCNMAIG